MTDDQLARKKALFLKAVALPPTEQLRFLKQECGPDERLLEELQHLLSLHEARTDALDRDAAELMGVAGSQSDETWQGVVERLSEFRPQKSRYTLKGELARGGMGALLAAYAESLRRTRAMKVILGRGQEPASATDQTSFGRFLDEAQVTAQLDHPGIVPVHELGVDGEGRVYFTMKLVQGRDLRQIFELVKSVQENWNTTRALNVILRVTEAMAFAHSKGVIHRDLKPANIMVGAFGETYVMDWGLARLVDQKDTRDLRVREAGPALDRIETERGDRAASSPDSPLVTMDGHVIGTPAYMAPEQAEGRLNDVGPHSDIYAMGCILYQLLTGRMPYTQPGTRVSPLAILRGVTQGPPEAIHRLNDSVPAELVAICDKAMDRSIPDRYPSMLDLAGDLRAYLERRVVSAYESGALAELKKWVLRNRALTATAAAALVVLSLVLAWAFGSIRSERDLARSQEAEATARKVEFDQLAGMVHLEQALASERELYPAHPELIPKIEAWLQNEAGRLERLKPALRQTLTDLRDRALPWSAADQQRDREQHPEFRRRQQLAARIDTLRRAQAVRDSGQPPAEVPLPPALTGEAVNHLFKYVFDRVNEPDPGRRIYGEEAQALALARHALAQVDRGLADPEDRPGLLEGLSWSLFANGLDTEALAANQQAIDLAHPQSRPIFVESRQDLEAQIAAAPTLLKQLQQELIELDRELSTRETYRFALESQAFLYETLLDLSERIAAFEAVERKGVEARLGWARRIDALTRDHPNALVTWDDAQNDLAAADGVLSSGLYQAHPIDLTPQRGLVPIGMNPVTLLWEFYDLRSAVDLVAGEDPAAIEIPTHEADGSIGMQDSTGIVFVLIPGGTFLMGAQRDDPDGRRYDPFAERSESPLNEVTLAPFFLARHELTMGQWKRLSSGGNPSWQKYGLRYSDDPIPIGWTHPVNQVSWPECDELMSRSGLGLPTEAQWEYATRAGTESVWWTGDQASSLVGAANVFDSTADQADPGWGEPLGFFSDEFASISPVGSFRANAFGLYDVAGNVFEWCRDRSQSYDFPTREGDGLRGRADVEYGERPLRGGACDKDASWARSSSRQRNPTSRKMNIIGLRPTRTIQ